MTDTSYNEHRLANDITETFGPRSDQETAILDLIRQRNNYSNQLRSILNERETWQQHAREAEATMYRAINEIRDILNKGN